HNFVAQRLSKFAQNPMYFLQGVDLTIKDIPLDDRQTKVLDEEESAHVNLIARCDLRNNSIRKDLEAPSLHSFCLIADKLHRVIVFVCIVSSFEISHAL